MLTTLFPTVELPQQLKNFQQLKSIDDMYISVDKTRVCVVYEWNNQTLLVFGYAYDKFSTMLNRQVNTIIDLNAAVIELAKNYNVLVMQELPSTEHLVDLVLQLEDIKETHPKIYQEFWEYLKELVGEQDLGFIVDDIGLKVPNENQDESALKLILREFDMFPWVKECTIDDIVDFSINKDEIKAMFLAPISNQELGKFIVAVKSANVFSTKYCDNYNEGKREMKPRYKQLSLLEYEPELCQFSIEVLS